MNSLIVDRQANVTRVRLGDSEKHKPNRMAEAEADELVAKAEKKLKGGLFGNMFGSKKEEAVELLQEAANKYKQVFMILPSLILCSQFCCRGRSVSQRFRCRSRPYHKTCVKFLIYYFFETQAKKWSSCGETHKRVAELQLELKDMFGAATSFQAAFQVN